MGNDGPMGVTFPSEKRMEERVLGIPFPERSRALTSEKCPLTKARSCFGAAKIILGVPSLVGGEKYSEVVMMSS